VRAQAPLQDQFRKGAGVPRRSGFDGLDFVCFRKNRIPRGPQRRGLETPIREEGSGEGFFRRWNCAPERGAAFLRGRILRGIGGEPSLMPAASGVQPDRARALHHSERAVVGSADPRGQEEQRDEPSTGNGAAQIHVGDITDAPGIAQCGMQRLAAVCSSVDRNHGVIGRIGRAGPAPSATGRRRATGPTKCHPRAREGHAPLQVR
jgi:hypothetical protein